MKRHRLLPYGTWSSSLTSEIASQAGLRFRNLHTDQGLIYLSLSNPQQKGRESLHRIQTSGHIEEITPSSFSMRSSVNEYGGKSFVFSEGLGILSSAENHQLYFFDNHHKLCQLTRFENSRFIDFVLHPSKQFLITVVERHENNTVKQSLCSIDLRNKKITTLAEGYDFYSSPRISPSGSHLAWVSWNHPHMPWDSTELFIAKLSIDSLKGTKFIAGSSSESILEPQWKNNKDLYFVSDKSSFWNLYKYSKEEILPLHPMPLDIGLAHWVYGNQRYCQIDTGNLAFIGTEEGIDHLYLLNTPTKQIEKINLPFTSYIEIYALHDHLIFIAADPFTPQTLYSYHLKEKSLRSLFSSQEVSIPKTQISVPSSLKISTEPLQTTYGFYYPPKQEGYLGTKKEKPPLLVRCHGGPTSHSPMRMQLEYLYFTTRGFALLDMNYSGSTGYGRDYRKKLHHTWGVTDVEDCIKAAKHLVKEGLVDPSRMIIKGGSAGGFTALSAITFHDLFQAAVSYYGVADLEDLVKSTHNFEKHYLDDLIGPYPECATRYTARSPLLHSERIHKPILFFHGKKDVVVPLSQTETMYQSIKNKNPLSELIVFDDEGHGFKSSETIAVTLEKELAFYLKLFGTTPTEVIPKTKKKKMEC